MPIKIKETERDTVKKVVGTQISQELFLKLKDEAEKNFMSVSDLLRKIIFIYYRDKDVTNNVKEKQE